MDDIVVKMEGVDSDVLAASALCLINVHKYLDIIRKNKEKKRLKRRWWMTAIHRNRTPQSLENMFEEMLSEDSSEFLNFCRMSNEDFEYLLQKVKPIIEKQNTRWRMAIPAKVRLAVTLRFLATGDSYRSLHYLFRISSPVISKIITDVCDAINKVLEMEIKMPQTPEDWLKIEEGFRPKFPHCCGAIDGKHVLLECPINSGSDYFNYKKTFSVVLLALVDSNYNFIFADIGSQGRISDGGVFQNSLIWKKIILEEVNLPSDSPLPGKQNDIPYVFSGDGAFALSTHVMKPFPGFFNRGSYKRTFNYRLSSSRVIVENVFGVLTSVFRIFKKPMELQPEKASLITMTCILLHNFLRRSKTSRNIYSPPGTFDMIVNGVITQEGSWRDNRSQSSGLRSMPAVARRARLNALQIREEFAKYFHENQ